MANVSHAHSSMRACALVRHSRSYAQRERAAGVLDEVLRLLVGHPRRVIVLDGDDDVTAVQLSVGGTSHEHLQTRTRPRRRSAPGSSAMALKPRPKGTVAH